MTAPALPRSAGTGARILDLAGHLPDAILDNETLAALYPDWTAQKIHDKTGIQSRHVAAEGETAADLACQAALALFARGALRPQDVDFVILCTQAPDYVLPTSACVLQARLDIPTSAGALDVNLGCSGYVYGLSLANGLIASGAAKCVLLLTADTYTRIIHPLDKSVRTLFGDGATATAVVADADGPGAFGPFVFGTDGRGADNLIVKAGMFRQPLDAASQVEQTDASGNVRTPAHLYMDGAAVMAFSLSTVPKSVQQLLEKAQCAESDIDYFVLHQASRLMLDALRKKLHLPPEKLPILMEHCGNTVSSSIPLALIAMRDRGTLKSGNRLALVGFGVGYSWAGCLVDF